ncbi:MAG: CvpA family protein [Pseudomonadota bacterium]
MTSFDFAVIIISSLSLLFGLWRGLVYEVLSLLGWPLAFWISKIFSVKVVPWMPAMQEQVRVVSSYLLVFAAVLIVWSVLVWLLSRLIKAVGLGWLDRILGGIFGLLRGGLVVLVIAWLAGLSSLPEQSFWREAQTSRVVEDVALLTKAWLPDSVAQRIRYGMRG